MHILLFTSIFLGITSINAWPGLIKRSPSISDPPPEVLRDLVIEDEYTVSNSKRDSTLNIGGFDALPDESK